MAHAADQRSSAFSTVGHDRRRVAAAARCASRTPTAGARRWSRHSRSALPIWRLFDRGRSGEKPGAALARSTGCRRGGWFVARWLVCAGHGLRWRAVRSGRFKMTNGAARASIPKWPIRDIAEIGRTDVTVLLEAAQPRSSKRPGSTGSWERSCPRPRRAGRCAARDHQGVHHGGVCTDHRDPDIADR